MPTGRKIVLGAVIVFIALLATLAVVVPLLVDVDRYRPDVVAHITNETGKPAEIGHLALSIFPTVSIRVDDFVMGNPPGFPKAAFVRARRIYAEVDPWALWHRQVLIKSLELDDPIINLLSDVRGKWNFENPPKSGGVKKASAGEPSSFSLGVISKVKIAGGQLTAANLLPSGRPGPAFFEGRAISSQLEQVDLKAFITSASASLVPRAPSPGLAQAGWITSLAYAAAPQPAAQGTLRAESLRFGALQVTAVKSRLRLFPKQVNVDDLNFDLYGGHARGDFSFNFAGQNPRYSTNARLNGVDVAKLLEAFPDARGKMTGTMEGNMRLSGEVTHSPDPLAGMRGTGQVSVRNGHLPSLQLNKNLMTLTRLSNLGPASGDPSSFSSISSDLNIANNRLTSNKITFIGNGVEVDGSGSLTLAREGGLVYEGVAKVLAEQNPLANILAGLSGATFANGRLSFPFTIAGTLQKPQFRLKPAGGAGGLSGLPGSAGGTQQPGQEGQAQQQSSEQLVQGITELFQKKQPSPQPPPQPQQQPKK